MIESQIFLIGMRGSGKSSVGRELAHLLGYSFVDTDVAFAERQKESIEAFVGRAGWDSFREVERATLLEVAEPCMVVGTGGGIIINSDNVLFMRESGVVVYLDVPVLVLAQRLTHDRAKESRPSLTGQDIIDEIGTIYDQRRELYENAAHIQVDGTRRTSLVAQEIKESVKIFRQKGKNK